MRDTYKKFTPPLWLGILGLAFLFVLLRWNNFDAPLTRDEGEYAYAAQLLIHGSAPYEHSFLQKPPMVAYSYALASLVAPDVFWAPRILANVFAALATLLIGYIARREFGPGVAMPAMWLMTPMILLPNINQFIANTEMFMLLPLVATVAVYVRSRHCKSGWEHWLAASVLAALTACYKYTALPLLAFIFAVWSFEEWRAGKSPRVIAGHWLAALVGGTAATAIVLAPFLLRDGGKRLWECTVIFNRFYASASGFGMGSLREKLGEFWHSWWILFLTLCLLPFNLERRVWFWAALFLVAWLGTVGSYYAHYYIAIMPFWALLAAVALRGFAAWIAIKVSQPQGMLRALFAGIVVLAVCAPDARWAVLTREQFQAARLGTFLEGPLVAARLAQLTTANDFVYVAGSEPQILCYAHRFSPTRFDIAYPLMFPTPLAKGYQAEAIHDLQQFPPAAIVLVRDGLSWLRQPGTPKDFTDFLEKLLAQNYEIVGGYVIGDKQSRWQEPMRQEDVAHCNMILFKRKVL
jgi:4-amino-4-deoxy-L-arabinose transferase-like glycosyltransferase